MADPIDTDELLEQGSTILFAVDQAPFPVSKGSVINHFSLLVPLVTESGARLKADPEAFPARGRVWWMLRPEMDPASIRPGMIWSGRLEVSQDYRSDWHDKDWYQISRKLATPGSARFLEILDVPDRDPALGDILAGGVSCGHSPLPRVLVRGPGFVTGPFRSCYDPGERRVNLEPLHPGDPWVYRCPRNVLNGAEEDFSFTGGRWDPHVTAAEIRVGLVHERHLEKMSGGGEKLDAATDVQVLNWGLKLLRITKRDQQPVKDLLHRTESVRDAAAELELAGRRERFLAICHRLDTVVGMGIEVAQAIADQEGFRELLERHKDALVEARVEEAVKGRQAEIDGVLTAEKERLERIRSDIAKLEDEFERRSKEQEEEFRETNEARLRDVEEREIRATERENALLESERAMEKRLARVIDTYRQEGEAIGDQLLGQVLLLRRAGVLGGPDESVTRPAPLALPAFLKKPRAAGGIDEAGFIEQLEHVVTRRGFAFEHEDLVSFHVAVKTGFWTVLAGASGLGKTSLSRLYAEALGVSDEHVLLPVRPDWLDDRDVIGAFNALSRRFEPAAGGLVERLIAAREDLRTARGGIYLICLDEMNLSRVEHYFAAFLSIMESPEGRRELPLFGAGLESPGDPYAPFRVLSIGDNVRFIGTVNIDETTHFFSPKVLDRATIVTLARPSLKEGQRTGVSSAELGGLVPIHLDEYRSWIRPPSAASQKILDLLVKIDETLRASRSGIGYRVRNRILAYVASACHLIGEEKALDLALFSSVVPRLRRGAPGWERLLKDLRGLLPAGHFPRTSDILSAIADEEGEFEFFLHL
ncbi:MAG: hypothetical protein JXP34_02315 [Planctomycetes bacterium]|nr:hypothetical protein [Planctomycetota bacterium]